MAHTKHEQVLQDTALWYEDAYIDEQPRKWFTSQP
jgi:hypothetical protein